MNIILAGQYAGAVIAILTLLGLIIKWAVVKPIKIYIDQATYQIQPGTNGGLSLSDLHKKVSEIKDLFDAHLENHK